MSLWFLYNSHHIIGTFLHPSYNSLHEQVKCTINHMSMFTNLGPWFDIPKDELAVGRACCKNGSKWWKCATVNIIRMADQWGRSKFREICCIPQPHCFVSWRCCKCPIWWESHWVHIWCVSSYGVYEAGHKMLIWSTHTGCISLWIKIWDNVRMRGCSRLRIYNPNNSKYDYEQMTMSNSNS